ncbi:MAG: YggT family protein [Firmicutes bacterium]|jgi:YggT family protein|nr:YggT family protein [Bacillota bacterium]MBQ1431249.1 YggT family protein [Bacillota bacterium]MBQ1630922.1 YggT family protein [Bacillota bacterium]MBQ1716237.1 YggT family protein [Bacillota bacterium]MBQ1826292.1 YggT family protein [Bacillota bacterium]
MAYVLIRAISLFAEVLELMLLARALLSWFVRDQYSTLGKIYIAIIRFTEPIVAPCRRALSRLNTGMFDFSVLLAMLLISAVSNILIRIIYMIAF